MNLLLVSVCLVLTVPAFSQATQHLLVVVVPDTEEQVHVLHQYQQTDYELDFWTHPKLFSNALIRMPVTRFGEVRKEWAKAGIQVTVRHENLEARVRQVAEEDLRERQIHPWTDSRMLPHNYYRSYNDVVDLITTLADDYPNLMSFDASATSPNREQTVEGRDIHYFELGSNPQAPVIFMEVNIHAREWITGAANLYMVNWLLANYGSNANATFLLDNYRIVNIPIANPDGLEYTHQNSNNRYWRKNRRSCSFGMVGVDLNRNFDYQWGGSGSSSSCSSDSYRGSSRASEPETRAVKALFQNVESNAAMYLSVHAFSQVILLPWTYSTSTSAYNTWHQSAGNAMAAAMTRVENRYHYAATAQAAIGYTASGSTVDWALNLRAGENQDFLALAYEMRPASGGGIADFNIPASNIPGAGQELLDSVIEVAYLYAQRTGMI